MVKKILKSDSAHSQPEESWIKKCLLCPTRTQGGRRGLSSHLKVVHKIKGADRNE
jgi:hypothetical protein